MKNFARFYKILNALQRQAVDTQEGPLLVLAGPGTGKTQLLSVRAAAILENKKAEPENILIVTFTNSAVKAMKERLAEIIGRAGYDIEVATFHSFANSILQESDEAVRYIGEKVQLGDVEKVRAIEYILDHTSGIDEIRPFRAPYFYANEIIQRIGDLKREGISVDEFEAYLRVSLAKSPYVQEKHKVRLEALGRVYAAYEELKAGKDPHIFDGRGRYDFDDMILFARAALENEKALCREYRKRFRYVMIDEYQDTNEAQLKLLFALFRSKTDNLCFVGDDDQSIFRFQGANIGNFKIIRARFPNLRVIELNDNYRSSQELLRISGDLIRTIPPKERVGEKTLVAARKSGDTSVEVGEFTTASEEVLSIIERIGHLKESIEGSALLTDEEKAHPYNNIAIIVRKRDDILRVIDALLQAGIPYATDGKEDIAGERRVAQLLGVLELAHADIGDFRARDLALFKVLSADYYGIPYQEIVKFVASVETTRRTPGMQDTTLLDAFLARYAPAAADGAHGGTSDRMRKAASAISRLLSEAPTSPVHTFLMRYIQDSGMLTYLLKEYHDNEVLRIRDLRAVASFVTMIKNQEVARPGLGLQDLMEELKLRKEHGLPVRGNLVTMTQDGVRVLTAHSAKGLEHYAVFIPFCLQNKNWPARRIGELIPLPPDLFKTREKIKDHARAKELFIHDETRLFYVALTRARAHLVCTSSPTEDAITSIFLKGIGREERLPATVDEEALLTRAVTLAPGDDPLASSSSVIRDMIASMALNPTRINTYLACRRRFFYNDVLKLPGPKKKSLVFGNCVHKALEDTYREFQASGAFPPFSVFQSSFMKELKYQGVDRSIELHCTGEAQMAKLKGWFDRAAKDPVMPIDLEKKIMLTIGDGIIFTGKYDKVEWEDEQHKAVRVIDYKSGKPDKHLKALETPCALSDERCDGYLRQLACYKLLYDRDKSQSALGRSVKKGALVFVEPVSNDIAKSGYHKGDYVTKPVEITQAMVDEMERLIINTWDNIKDLHFERLAARDKDKCPSCDFHDICWS